MSPENKKNGESCVFFTLLHSFCYLLCNIKVLNSMGSVQVQKDIFILNPCLPMSQFFNC